MVESSSAGRNIGSWVTPALVAIALAGFWLYLGLLTIIGVAPRTGITAVYYGLLGACIWPIAWYRRSTLRDRLLGSVTARVFTGATGLLFAWFLIDVAAAGGGTLSRRLAGQLLLSTAPAALVAASLTRSELKRLLGALVGLGAAYSALSLAMLHRGTTNGRFSPLTHLDPISAAQVAAIGLIAAVALSLPSRRANLLRLPLVVLLVFGLVLPGSRGPVLGTAAALGIMLLLGTNGMSVPFRIVTAATLIAAAVLASWTAFAVGSGQHFISDVPSTGNQPKAAATPARIPAAYEDAAPLTSGAVRIFLYRYALRESRGHLLFGNGVGTLASESAEAKRLGVFGCCTWPHNEPLEALYSLGLGGLVCLLVAIFSAAVAAFRLLLILLHRKYRTTWNRSIIGFFLAFGAYAFIQSQLSGEIGADVPLWTAAALLTSSLAWLDTAR